jgi:hypothetical protein
VGGEPIIGRAQGRSVGHISHQSIDAQPLLDPSKTAMSSMTACCSWEECCHRYWRGRECRFHHCKHPYHVRSSTHRLIDNRVFIRQDATTTPMGHANTQDHGSRDDSIEYLPHLPAWLTVECRRLHIDLIECYEQSRERSKADRLQHTTRIWDRLFCEMSSRACGDKREVMEACCYCHLYHGLLVRHPDCRLSHLRLKYGTSEFHILHDA